MYNLPNLFEAKIENPGMKEIYDWVPWFRELAKKIAKWDREYFNKTAREVDWCGSNNPFEQINQIDPLHFFLFLAEKNTKHQRDKVYRSVHEKFNLSGTPLEMTEHKAIDGYVIQGLATLIPHPSSDLSPIWSLFKQAVEDNPDIERETFKTVLDISKIGVTRLTQWLFLINPECFIPVDKRFPRLAESEKKIKENGWDAYKKVLEDIKAKYPGYEFYKIARNPTAMDRRMKFKEWARQDCSEETVDRYDTLLAGERTSSRNQKEVNNALNSIERGDSIVYDLTDLAELEKVRQNCNEQKRIRQAENPNTGGKAPTSVIGKYIKFLERQNNNSVTSPQPKTMKYSLNQILYGPPGTGKTWRTINLAVAIIEGQSEEDLVSQEGREEIKRRFDELKEAGQIEMVTFHQNYTYEDFIEGIRPLLADTRDGSQRERDLAYELCDGIFKEIVKRAESDPEQNYTLIIDEINRGNIAKIFGELITLIEESKRINQENKEDQATVILPYSQESFGVPANLYIIGAMNTADRSIALLDTALRRRFRFIEMMPDIKHVSENVAGVNCRKMLEAMNERIRFLFDREHQIGHTYFIKVSKMHDLADTFKFNIIPLLQEYFYDDWEKIDQVLNKNGFIQPRTVESSLLQNSDLTDIDRPIYELIPVNDDKWQNRGSYISIYSDQQSSRNGQDTEAD